MCSVALQSCARRLAGHHAGLETYATIAAFAFFAPFVVTPNFE